MGVLEWLINKYGTKVVLAPATKGQNQNIHIDYYFTRVSHDLDKHVIDIIDSSHLTLDIAIYYLVKPNITDAIIRAHKRGVKVRIITDRIQSHDEYSSPQLNRLVGIPIKYNKHDGLMHLKIIIRDYITVATGSYNYTGRATTSSDENLVVITNLAFAAGYSDEFCAMWKSNQYIDY